MSIPPELQEIYDEKRKLENRADHNKRNEKNNKYVRSCSDKLVTGFFNHLKDNRGYAGFVTLNELHNCYNKTLNEENRYDYETRRLLEDRFEDKVKEKLGYHNIKLTKTNIIGPNRVYYDLKPEPK